MSAGWKTDIRYPDQTIWLSTCRKTTWTNIKGTTAWIQSWGRNRSFIGLTSWQEKE